MKRITVYEKAVCYFVLGVFIVIGSGVARGKIMSGTAGLQSIEKKNGIQSAKVSPKPDGATRERIMSDYGRLPLSFEENKGQTDEQVRFLSRNPGLTLFLTPSEAVLKLSKTRKNQSGVTSNNAAELKTDKKLKQEPGDAYYSVLRMKLMGANEMPVITGTDRQPGKSNYFMGNNPEKWRTNVPNFKKVKYAAVYPGIDLVYYGNRQSLEYDFIVSPNADPDTIRISFDGAKEISIDKAGNLVLEILDGELVFKAPSIYQESNGKRMRIGGAYELHGKEKQVGFRLASYDRSRTLVIDPVLAYSTYLGGSSGAYANDISVNPLSGRAHITGSTVDLDFPTVNPVQPEFAGGFDVIVTTLNPQGSALEFSTYFGHSGSESGHAIASDYDDHLYIAGYTTSNNFPTVQAYQSTKGGSTDAFLVRLINSGTTIHYSTYLGGSDYDDALDVAFDNSGNAYIAGWTGSDNFPLSNPYQSINHNSDWSAFVTKFSPDGLELIYSTYLGGGGQDSGRGIAVDPVSGEAYVTGYAGSAFLPPDFPTTPGAYDTTCGVGADCDFAGDTFVTKFSADGSALLYSTFLGGSNNETGRAIDIDDSGSAYVAGETRSTDFPVLNAVQASKLGDYDAFVTKLSADGSALVYSTYLGGGSGEKTEAYGIAVDDLGKAHVVGRTQASDFPQVDSLQPVCAGGSYDPCEDAFLSIFDPSGQTLEFSTFFGGSGNDRVEGVSLDAEGNAYIAGYTRSSDLYTSPFAFQKTLLAQENAFIAKIGTVTAADPVPDIRANGSDGPVALPQGSNLSVDISLDPGSYDQTLADWWIRILLYNQGTGQWIPIVNNTFQSPLFNLPVTELLNTSGLPQGTFLFLFGVDLVPNGVLDTGQWYYDFVPVIIQ